MLELQTFGPAFGVASASAPCMKAMGLLNMANLDWRPDFEASLEDAPMQKFPVLKDGETIIPDSSFIQKHLEDKYNADFGNWLTPEQRATAHALTRMAEEHIYFVILNDRWNNDANWKHVSSLFFSQAPKEVADEVRNMVIGTLMGNGIARFPQKMLLERIEDDITAVADCLGQKPFLFGDKACFADLSIAAQLSAMAASPEASPFADLVNGNPIISSWIDRVSKEYFPDSEAMAA